MDFYVSHGSFPLKFTGSNYGGFHSKYDPFDESVSKKQPQTLHLKIYAAKQASLRLRFRILKRVCEIYT